MDADLQTPIQQGTFPAFHVASCYASFFSSGVDNLLECAFWMCLLMLALTILSAAKLLPLLGILNKTEHMGHLPF